MLTHTKRHLLFWLLGVCLFVGGFVSGAHSSFLKGTTASSTPTSLYDDKVFDEVRSLLTQKFIPWKASNTPPTAQDLEYGMISGYVSAYKDPYTIFFPPRQAKNFTQNVQGSFGGVGMQVTDKDGRVVVIAPLKDSPSMKAGIKPGDIIVAVDKKDVSGMSSDEAVSLIRGDIGTTVNLTVLHKDAKEVSQISIVREEIKIPTIDTEKKDGVFVIRLYNFSAESPTLFEKALKDFSDAGTQYMILDLRGNPGGYLESAVDMASFFLPEGKEIVTEKRGNGQADEVHRSRGFNYFNSNLKMVILLDGGSASASEILAGALKDQGIAKIVGDKSFGKGSVQELVNLVDGSALKVTVAKWYTPKGISISENGITPDFPVKLDTALFAKGTDTQLKKAIEVVKSLK